MHREQLSLEELSAAAGMTARNVRAYQTKGLIPPPARNGRRSVYGLDHLRRLQAIERARSRGASLSLIASHLEQGRSLDDDTLISWQPMVTQRADSDGVAPDASRTEIGPLLARMSQQRRAAAQEHVDQLIAAGVFEADGRNVWTGRDLAVTLTALQAQGLSIEAALGVAQRAVAAARPVAESVSSAVAGLDTNDPVVLSHLGDLAGNVVRQVIRRAID